jgi:hypothetical protein
MALPFTDDFTGTNGDPWDSGKWTITKDEGDGTVDIQSNTGRIATSGTAERYLHAEANSDTAVQDCSLLLSIDPLQSSNSINEFEVCLRSTGTPDSHNGYPVDCYMFGGYFDGDNLGIWTSKMVAGVWEDLLGSVTSRSTFNVKAWLRFEVEDVASDVVVRSSSWDDGESEPGSWDNEITDTSPGSLFGKSSGRLELLVWTPHAVALDNRIDDLVFDELGGTPPSTPLYLPKRRLTTVRM